MIHEEGDDIHGHVGGTESGDDDNDNEDYVYDDLLLLCVRSLRPILITLCDMFDLCQERVYVAHWFGRPLNA